MIVIGEKSKTENILHLIIGPETNNQFNFNGRTVQDISEYIRDMDEGKPCKLVMNKCESEGEILQIVAMQEGQKKANKLMQEVQSRMNGGESESEKPAQQKIKASDGKTKLKCPKCLEPDAAVVRDGFVFPCRTCQEIDAGLEANEVGPLPTEEDLAIIKEDLEREFPDQAASSARYSEEDVEFVEEEPNEPE